MRVVNLNACRDLLRVWGQVRQELIDGAEGFAVCIRKDGAESVFFAGEYEGDKEEAAKAAMRLSWELTKAQEPKVGKP
jgi:hypothetical protein